METPEVVQHDRTGVIDNDLLLADLDPDRREAIVLTQLAGLSYADAAGVLQCPIGTVRSRVARARLDLLQMVADSDAEGGHRRAQ